MSKADIEEANKSEESSMDFVHHKDQTKDILGYKTHLVEMVPKDKKGEDVKMTFWVTEEIQTSATVSQGIDNSELGGLPMQFSMELPNQFSMTTTCTEISKDFDESVFDFDKKGYREVNPKDLQNMGSMGF
ncbi:MAG: hypothetical protein R2771_10325 [Saprospiraceae bacterium]